MDETELRRRCLELAYRAYGPDIPDDPDGLLRIAERFVVYASAPVNEADLRLRCLEYVYTYGSEPVQNPDDLLRNAGRFVEYVIPAS